MSEDVIGWIRREFIPRMHRILEDQDIFGLRELRRFEEEIKDPFFKRIFREALKFAENKNIEATRLLREELLRRIGFE